MNCQEARAKLDDFVDGELPERPRQMLQRHLAVCSGCRRQEEELRALLAAARRLPGIPPQRDLWPEIEARLRRRPWFQALDRFWEGRARLAGQLLLAAAVVVLAVLSIPLVRQRLEAPADPIVATPLRERLGGAAALAELARSEDGVLRTRRDLLATIEGDRGVLAPATLATVESGARVLDVAIGEIREALEANPDDPHLSLLLASRYQQEVVLLKRLNRV